jgi:hypothetical protein
MFGHQDPHQDNNDQNTTQEPAADAMLAHDPAATPGADPATVPPAPAVDGNDDGNDSVGDYIMTEPHQGAGAPADDDSEERTLPATVPAHTATDDLVGLKQKALQQLSPLVGHLDQTPEEKFRTTMMLIQASDNQDLLSTAYEAAQAIPDEKLRAQALLDVVNEINYFTHQDGSDEPAQE